VLTLAYITLVQLGVISNIDRRLISVSTEHWIKSTIRLISVSAEHWIKSTICIYTYAVLDCHFAYFLYVLKELTIGEESFTPSDVERALWSSAIGSKSPASGNPKSESKMRGKRKR
jgi:hypothetical protein